MEASNKNSVILPNIILIIYITMKEPTYAKTIYSYLIPLIHGHNGSFSYISSLP